MVLFLELQNIVGNMNNFISNLVSILKNATTNNKLNVILKFNIFIFEIIKLLYVEGFIISYKLIHIQSNTYIYCILKKTNGTYLIHNIQMISKPSQRVYVNLQKLKYLHSFNNGETTFIISTPQGVFTGKHCLNKEISGELLIKIN